ncbi:MAG: isochorismatase [Clostridiales bacterium]|nr:MAG: isochorismatase [Clostridiales bacterium]
MKPLNLKAENSALLIIDIQEVLFPLISENERIAKNANILINGSKILDIKTIIVEQYTKGLGFTIKELQKSCEDLIHLEKTSFSAYLDHKEVLDELKTKGIDTIIISGIETHICVYQTAKDLIQNGFNVCVAYDACGSRLLENHDKALSTLKHIGATIIPTETILFEILKTAKHPKFKEISKLVK